MFKFKKYMGIATLVAIVAALGISSAAMAQSSTTPTPGTGAPTAPTTQDAQTAPVGHRGGFGLRSQAALDAAAKELGITADELQAELWGGKTLSDLATEQGVDIADVQAAVEAAEKAEVKTSIEAAVTAGTLTQAKADWLLEGLNAGYWGPGVDGAPGKGFGIGLDGGMGRGGHGGRGGFGGANGIAPDSNGTTPNSTPGTTAPSGTAF
ncbi:hypothetical protein GPROT1_01366 [Gammaproteobacteria bacterium]|nr:hypothetical protein GPROT1_01366 [Gammaproteobacteria bacterium]